MSLFCSNQEETQPSLEPMVENFESDNHMRQAQKQTLRVCFQSRRKCPKQVTPTN